MIWKPLRHVYIKTTDLSRNLQGSFSGGLDVLYRVWSRIYDVTARLDPAYLEYLHKMVDAVVQPGDRTLDMGSGTGLATLRAAAVARQVVGVDPSREMTRRLRRKLEREKILNVRVRDGQVPRALEPGEVFDSVISSFMLAHLLPAQRKELLARLYQHIVPGGRLGLFSSRGEIAASFQTKSELWDNLSAAGFHNIRISDVADIYRITTAVKTRLLV